MAHEDVVKFIEKAVGDAEVQAKLKDIKATNDEEAMKQVIQIAADSGCSFKESEFDDLCLVQAAAEAKNETGQELSPEQLESVAGAGRGDSQTQLFMANKEMQELNQSFNMQFLALQQKLQQENRQFSALSNVMKTKHDTAKNALNNLK